MTDPRFSPSAQSAYRLCNRRWWFKAACGLKEPADPTLSWGTALHLVMENYCRNGVVLTPGEYPDSREIVRVTSDHIARATQAFPNLPPPGTMQVEVWAPRLKIGGMLVAAKTDLIDPAGRRIQDHKSTKTIKTSGPWAKCAAKLQGDEQGLFYSGAFQNGGIMPRGDVEFTHNYVQSTGPISSLSVSVVFSQTAIDAAWEGSVKTAEGMKVVLDGVPRVPESQDAVPFNLGSCNAFNRPCAFEAICTARKKTAPAPLHQRASALDLRQTPPRPGGPLAFSLAGHLPHLKKPSTTAIAGQPTPTPATPPAKEAPLPAATPAPERPPETQAASAPPSTTAPNTAPLRIIPPEAVPVDVALVRPAFVRECVAAVKAMADAIDGELTLADVEAVCAENCLPPEYHVNVAILAGVQSPAHTHGTYGSEPPPFPSEDLLTAPLSALIARQTAAAALAEVPTAALAEVAREAAPEVVRAAVANLAAAEPERAAVLEKALPPSERPAVGASADDILKARWAKGAPKPSHKAAVTALLTTETDRIDATDVDKALRAAGCQRVHATAVQAVLEDLAALPGLLRVGDVIQRQEAPGAPANPSEADPQSPLPFESPTPPNPPADAPPESASEAASLPAEDDHTRAFTPEEIAAAREILDSPAPPPLAENLTTAVNSYVRLLAPHAEILQALDRAARNAPRILVISSAPPEGMDYEDFEKVPWIAAAREDAWERCDRRHGATPLVWNAYGVGFAATWMSVLSESVARGFTLPAGVTWIRAGSALGLTEPRYGLREMFLSTGAGVIG